MRISWEGDCRSPCSRVVGAAHVDEASFWSSGGIATDGIESMAETGAVATFCNEVQAEADRQRAGGCIRGQEASFQSPGTVTLTFDVDEGLPFLTLVSMIAPSPDWFVGIDGVALQQGGCWTPRIEMDLAGYDAGTDSGTTFTAPAPPTSPRTSRSGRSRTCPRACGKYPLRGWSWNGKTAGSRPPCPFRI